MTLALPEVPEQTMMRPLVELLSCSCIEPCTVTQIRDRTNVVIKPHVFQWATAQGLLGQPPEDDTTYHLTVLGEAFLNKHWKKPKKSFQTEMQEFAPVKYSLGSRILNFLQAHPEGEFSTTDLQDALFDPNDDTSRGYYQLKCLELFQAGLVHRRKARPGERVFVRIPPYLYSIRQDTP